MFVWKFEVWVYCGVMVQNVSGGGFDEVYFELVWTINFESF